MLLCSLGELRLFSFMAMADELCCNRNWSQQRALSPCCATAAWLHEKNQPLPQNTDWNSHAIEWVKS